MPRRMFAAENTGSTELLRRLEKIMYIGSVKFFKHLIYTVVFAWLAIATFLAVFFGIKYFILKNDISENAGVSNDGITVIEPGNEAEIPEQIVIPEGTNFEQLFLVMLAKGYTPEEMLAVIETGDEDVFRSYVEGYISANPDLAPADTETVGGEAGIDSSAEYTKLYPDLYVENKPAEFKQDEGTIYLTFDDGPSERTPEVLDILKTYGIKATFFVCGGTDEESQKYMKRVVDEGHTIAIHSISHDYGKIYESVESYLDDFYETYTCVYEATGVKPEIFRFPGGSINNYNRFTYMQIIAEMTRRGFVYYDWNVSGEDAVKGADWTSIYNNIMNYIPSDGTGRAIVLLHDSKDKHHTVNVLSDVIEELTDMGYKFDKLDNSVKPTTFSYKD